MKRLLLIVLLLVLPHHARAASIPLVLTFDTEGIQDVFDVVSFHKITPIVMHVVLTFDDVMESVSASAGAWVKGRIGGVQFDGHSFPELTPVLPAPDGTQIGESLVDLTDEWRYASWYGSEPGVQRAIARWERSILYGSPQGTWTSVMGLGIASESRRLFTQSTMDLGTPTVLSMLETLAWGGSVSLRHGWYYDEEAGDVSIRSLIGTYALDAEATAIPEPASLVLLASGLALARVRSARRMRPRSRQGKGRIRLRTDCPSTRTRSCSASRSGKL